VSAPRLPPDDPAAAGQQVGQHDGQRPAAGAIPAALALDPRMAVLLISGFATVALAAALTLLPMPYAVLRPGPVLNTLGSAAGTPLITVTGRRTYPTTGVLDLTTLRTLGGPGRKVTLAQVLAGWVDPTVSVVPVQQIFPPDQTQKQTDELNQQLMTSSQESATAAALTALGIDVPTTLAVAGVDPDAPAASVLRPGDVILAVDGRAVPTLSELRERLQALHREERAAITVRRSGSREQVTVRTSQQDGRTVLGVFIDPTFRFPFQVKIQIENVGGPSAGLMFALGIIDNLTPGDLTGGQRIAGTGTIAADGTVGRIGGIQQKLVGARRAGARWFLAPAGNCDEVVGHVPDGLRVVRVSTLEQARSDLQTIAAGTAAAALPSC
jgi:PDZ domain-containing protein